MSYQEGSDPMSKQRQRRRYSKWLVTLIISANMAFTAIVLWLFAQTGHEPVALIAAFFGFTTGELWLLAGIKKAKIKKEHEGGETHDKLEN